MNEILNNLHQLPSIPAVVQELISNFDNPELDSQHLAQKIGQDQALAAKVLRVANSAFYGLPRQVGSIQEAVVVLGFNTVRSLALSISMVDFLTGRPGKHQINYSEFWKHSIGVSIMARAIAKKSFPPLAEDQKDDGVHFDRVQMMAEDYLRMGIGDALDAVEAICGLPGVHAVGYCLGGTLLAIAAAAMARDGDTRLASITMLAAQTDFSEPGELGLFIEESQMMFLEDIMFDRGYLSAGEMSGAFQLLRSNDLFWSRAVHQYLMGEPSPMTDMMAWNADTTRMPYRMHAQYLRRLFLNNDLALGRYRVTGKPVALSDVRVPMFVVGTETDHVAPWRSVYKVGKLVRSVDYTFCLTSGGPNAGISSGPQHPKRRHRVHTSRAGARLLSPDRYLERVEPQPGSWWPTWAAWLEEHSSPRKVAPPAMGAPKQKLKPLCAAPGTYVLAK